MHTNSVLATKNVVSAKPVGRQKWNYLKPRWSTAAGCQATEAGVRVELSPRPPLCLSGDTSEKSWLTDLVSLWELLTQVQKTVLTEHSLKENSFWPGLTKLWKLLNTRNLKIGLWCMEILLNLCEIDNRELWLRKAGRTPNFKTRAGGQFQGTPAYMRCSWTEQRTCGQSSQRWPEEVHVKQYSAQRERIKRLDGLDSVNSPGNSNIHLIEVRRRKRRDSRKEFVEETFPDLKNRPASSG